MPAILSDIQAKYGDSVYPLYKDYEHEPYMENENGNGYKGVVLYDEQEDRVQCSICGEWFKELAAHIKFKHNMKSEQYKDSFGLYRKTPLCSKSRSRISSETALKRIDYFLEHRNLDFSNAGKSTNKHGRGTQQHKNTYGLCDAQIAARVLVVLSSTEKTSTNLLTSTDFAKYDPVLGVVIQRKYGDWSLAAKALDLCDKGAKYEDAALISKLRIFVAENGYIPYANHLSDLGLGSFGTYVRHFGSWRRAKEMAGLDQLLQEVKSGQK